MGNGSREGRIKNGYEGATRCDLPYTVACDIAKTRSHLFRTSRKSRERIQVQKSLYHTKRSIILACKNRIAYAHMKNSYHVPLYWWTTGWTLLTNDWYWFWLRNTSPWWLTYRSLQHDRGVHNRHDIDAIWWSTRAPLTYAIYSLLRN